MSRRITQKDVIAVVDEIVRESDDIRAIKADPGNSTHNYSWMFTFYLTDGSEHQHTFWNLSLLTAKEAHMFLRGMLYMLGLQRRNG
jgi:hypothetical protein